MTSPATQEPCPECNGAGGWANTARGRGVGGQMMTMCEACEGTGLAPPSQRAELLTQELESAMAKLRGIVRMQAPTVYTLDIPEAAALLHHIAALEQRVAELANDRSAKTKRMWELGHECDRLAARAEAADKLADAASAYNTQKLLWKPAHWNAVAEALAAYRALPKEPRNG